MEAELADIDATFKFTFGDTCDKYVADVSSK